MPNYDLSSKISLTNTLSRVVVVLVIVLGLANLVLTNLIVTDGVRLNSIIEKTNLLAKENQELQAILANSKSLASVESKAEILGFVATKNITTINSIDVVAQIPNQ